MTGSLDFLLDISGLAPVTIKLPNGRVTVSTKMGSVRLGSSLTLQCVYYIDGLHCPLISVSHLTRDRSCLFQLTDKICIIQDHITLMLIGVGESSKDYIFLRGVETVTAIQGLADTTADVWHRRLGHPSSKAMEML